MQKITRTALGAQLQTNHFLKLPHIVSPNTTLNQKFDIHNNIALTEDDMPSADYYAIGNGGHAYTIGINNIPLIDPVLHKSRSAALYNHLPFVLRLPTDDLSPTQRNNYRLRKNITIGSQTYIAYYLRKIDKTNTESTLQLKEVVDDVVTSTPFAHTLQDLSPTPPVIDNEGNNTTTGNYLSATARITFSMNEFDITEFLNVANIMYNDDSYAIISEIALCSGVDRTVNGVFNGINSSYVEAIGVQCASFINSMFMAKFMGSSFNIEMDVGSTEPLLFDN